ncbi:MAG: hypothetical protein M1138_06880 [Candidatus Thermoplasmatota archaeon]|nr:hypothetical protein [Candidatus Thermoplasmatota archaeon]
MKLAGAHRTLLLLAVIAIAASLGATMVMGTAAPVASPSPPSHVVMAVIVSDSSSSSGINASSIFSDIWGIVNSFLKGIVSDIGTFINQIIVQSLGNSFVTIFSNWGYSVSSEGIWAPFVAIVVLALSGYALYAFIDLYGLERDVLHGEEDI